MEGGDLRLLWGSVTISSETMPIYEYECRRCGRQFELLVLKTTVAACPGCKSRKLEQLLSGFAVSSQTISEANVRDARRKLATSSNYRDQKVAEADEIKEHSNLPPPPKPGRKVVAVSSRKRK
jgi:putative FmdB family regulatory protein